MKELSIEEKAKAYDEIIVKAKKMHSEVNDVVVLHHLEELIPDITESEDERIRKALINGFNKLDKSAVWYNGITNGQILAWLEKQGEQKPVEEVKWHDSTDEFYADALVDMVKNSDLTDRDKENRLVWIEKHRAKPIEWNEESKIMLQRAIYYTNYYQTNYADTKEAEECINWLKSLHPRNHWKSSEEQIKALEFVLNDLDRMCVFVYG